MEGYQLNPHIHEVALLQSWVCQVYQYQYQRSLCHQNIFVRKGSSNPDVLVKRLLTRKDLSFIPAIKWGIEHEEEAREAYNLKMSSSHAGFECSLAGLVINPLYPYLGASPDVFSHCNCCGDGITEIKCPFSVKDGKPEDLKGEKNIIFVGLVQSHKYYTQVQGQLEVSGRDFCDFVVWTPNGLFIQRYIQRSTLC